MRSTVGARSRIFTLSHRQPSGEASLRTDSPPGTSLERHRPRKRFSQNFLRDQRVADAIVRAARLSGNETVVEIGPGLGILTQRLIRQAHRLIAVEIDRDLAARLPATVVSDDLVVLQMDALQFDPAAFGVSEYVLVANLPYHITSPVLMRFLHEVTRPTVAILMMQREVAERLAAAPGHLSYLGVAVQSVAAVEIVRQVPPSAFTPRPKVDSTVLRITPRPDALADDDFLSFVRAGFTQPRKRLANSLSQGLNLPKSALDAFLEAQGIGNQARAHELSIEQWHQLSSAWINQRQP